jgi:hypothetical protein
MPQAPSSVIYFPKQSKPTPTPKKKKPGQKCTVLEWIRGGYQFPVKPAPGGAR